MTRDPQEIKGKEAEQLVNEIAAQVYLPLFCYPNPMNPETKKEICDLLVVCGSTAVIWQIKNLKAKEGVFKEHEISKAVRQSRGARKRLEKMKALNARDMSGSERELDLTSIRSWHQVAAFIGVDPEMLPLLETSKHPSVHLFTDTFVRKSFGYLDTLADLTDYLASKEQLLEGSGQTSITVLGGEEDLLTHFLQNERSFLKFEEMLKDVDGAVLDLAGSWSDFQKSDLLARKKAADSLGAAGWDSLISVVVDIPSTDDDSAMKHRLIETMSSHSRLQRRALGDSFYEGWTIAASEDPKRDFRRYMPIDEQGERVVYLFLWAGTNDPESRKYRRAVLRNLGLVAKKEYPDFERIIGIGAPKPLEHMTAHDFVLLEFDDESWTAELQKEAASIQEEFGYFKSPIPKHIQTSEFPLDD